MSYIFYIDYFKVKYIADTLYVHILVIIIGMLIYLIIK